MAEVKIPTPEVCDFLIERLPMLSDVEEHQMMKFGEVLLSKGAGQRKIRLNQILDSMSYLCRVGIVSYTERFGAYGMRLHFRRTADEPEIRTILGEPPPAPARVEKEAAEGQAEPQAEPEPEVKKKKKKKKPCCDNPHPVKNKKTGKRRCKNCNTKLKSKKKKE